nr:PREDICTED: uncharacterized protein LOC109036650 [Bemisia tabaci]
MPFTKPMQQGKTSTTKPKIPMSKKRKLGTGITARAHTQETLKKTKPTEEPHKKFAIYAQKTFRRMKAWNPPLKNAPVSLLVKSFDHEVTGTSKETDNPKILQSGQAFTNKIELKNVQVSEKISCCSTSPKLKDSENPYVNESSLKSTHVDVCNAGDRNQSESRDQHEALNCSGGNIECPLTQQDKEKSREIMRESQREIISNQTFDLIPISDQKVLSKDNNNLKATADSEFQEQSDKKIESVEEPDNLSRKACVDMIRTKAINFVETSFTEKTYDDDHLQTFKNEEYFSAINKNEELCRDTVLGGLDLDKGELKNVNQEKGGDDMQNIRDRKGNLHFDKTTKTDGDKSSDELSSDDDLDDIVSKAIDKYMNEEVLAKGRDEILAQEKIGSSQETIIWSPQKPKPKRSVAKKQQSKHSKEKTQQNIYKNLQPGPFFQQENYEPKTCIQSKKDEINGIIDITEESETVSRSEKSTAVSFENDSELGYDSDGTIIIEPITCNSTVPDQNFNCFFQKGENNPRDKRVTVENTQRNIDTENQKDTSADFHMHKTETLFQRGNEMVKNSEKDFSMSDKISCTAGYLNSNDYLEETSLRAMDKHTTENCFKTHSYISEFQHNNEADLFLQVEESNLSFEASKSKSPNTDKEKFINANLDQASGSTLRGNQKSFCLTDQVTNLLDKNGFQLDEENYKGCNQTRETNSEEHSIIDQSSLNSNVKGNMVLQVNNMETAEKPYSSRKNLSLLAPVSIVDKQNLTNSVRASPQQKQTGKTTEKIFRTFNDLCEDECLFERSSYSLPNKKRELLNNQNFLLNDTSRTKFNQKLLQANQTYVDNNPNACTSEAEVPKAEYHLLSPLRRNIGKVGKTPRQNKGKMKEKLRHLKGLMDQSKIQREKKIDDIRELVFETNIYIYDLIDSLKPSRNG